MAKSPSKENIELAPDAWQRFERAIDVVAKSPPQHKAKRKGRRSPSKHRGAKKKSG